MSDQRHDFPKIQSWMQSAIMFDGTVDEALRSNEVRSIIPFDEAHSVLTPSAHLSASERLDIYRAMYPLRMEEALRSDYPTLAVFLDADFPDFCKRYTQHYPSCSYSLNHFGKHVEEFVSTVWQGGNTLFVRNLARIEWAISEAIDETEDQSLGEEDVARMTMNEWQNATLKLTGATRLLSLDSNALDAVLALDRAQPLPPPKIEARYAVVYRVDFTTDYDDLSAGEYAALQSLAAGKSMLDAIGTALAHSPVSEEHNAEIIKSWFESWTQKRLLKRISP